MKKIYLFIFTLITYAQPGAGQSKGLFPQKVNKVDSVAQSIDSLISKKAFISFSLSSVNSTDSSQYTREYYVDPKNSCVVKCILDTTFEDFDKVKLRQLIVYFYNGHEFNTLWVEAKNSDIALGTNRRKPYFILEFKNI